MSGFVLQRTTDGKWVAEPGSHNSYVSKIENARVFKTRAEAEKDRCPENERIVEIHMRFIP